MRGLESCREDNFLPDGEGIGFTEKMGWASWANYKFTGAQKMGKTFQEQHDQRHEVKEQGRWVSMAAGVVGEEGKMERGKGSTPRGLRCRAKEFGPYPLVDGTREGTTVSFAV